MNQSPQLNFGVVFSLLKTDQLSAQLVDFLFEFLLLFMVIVDLTALEFVFLVGGAFGQKASDLFSDFAFLDLLFVREHALCLYVPGNFLEVFESFEDAL